MKEQPTLSIVATLYKSERYIDDFLARCSAAASSAFGADYEIVLVNDGSPDGSRERAIAAVAADPHLKLVDLSRNFGHHRAIMTGLAHASGQFVFLIDSDLEEPPECLSNLLAVMNQSGCDVVYGVQTERKGEVVERLGGKLFWKLINSISGTHIPEDPLTARLMTRAYVDALLLHQEREVFLAGLWHITGFKQLPLPILKASKGHSSYRLVDRIKLMVNAITSFSNAPLTYIFYCGVLIFAVSLLYTSELIFVKIFFGGTIEGWTSLVVSIWLLGGLVISFLGVIGIYLSKIYSEVKQRPYSIIRKIYENGSS